MAGCTDPERCADYCQAIVEAREGCGRCGYTSEGGPTSVEAIYRAITSGLADGVPYAEPQGVADLWNDAVCRVRERVGIAIGSELDENVAGLSLIAYMCTTIRDLQAKVDVARSMGRA